MKLKGWGYIFFLLTLSSMLIGCSSTTEAPEISEGSNGENAEEGEYGGTLNFAFNVQPTTLDPHFTTDTATRDLAQHIFEPLLTLNTSLEVEPMLAESYDVSEDGKTITFHLRQGIKFHNGKEMTADDVIASMERWQEMSAQAKQYLEGTVYEAEDDYTVVAHIADPTTLDLFIFADMTQFAGIMPKEIAEAVGTEAATEYIGTGPYHLEEWRKDQHIHLNRFDDYSSRPEPANGLAGEKKAYLDEIYIHIVTESSTRTAGIQSGEYEMANAIPQDSIELLEMDPMIKNEVYANSFPSIIFNKKARFLSNEKARQAVNAALNMEDLLTSAYGESKYYEADHALVKEDQKDWYTDAGRDVYHTYDPELAKQLLKEAGYNGEEIIILTSRDREEYYNMSVVIQQQLEAIGMNISLEVSDWGTVLERAGDEQAYDIFFTAFAFRPMPVQYLFFNHEWLGWTDSEELEQLKEQILGAASQEEAQKFSAQLHEAFYSYLPIIKTGNSTAVISMRENVEGLQFITGPILWNVSVK